MVNRRGLAVGLEAILLFFLSVLLVLLAFTFFTSLIPALNPDVRVVNASIALCGSVLTIYNLGETPLYVETVMGVTVLSDGRVVETTEPVNKELPPKQYLEVYLSESYDYAVVIFTNNKGTPPVSNECVWDENYGGEFPTQ